MDDHRVFFLCLCLMIAHSDTVGKGVLLNWGAI